MSTDIIRTSRLPAGEFINAKIKKTGICVHHTVGGSALSTFDYWRTDPRRVGTAYIIERDGKIYEVFDPEYWAFQFGLSSSAGWTNDERYAFEGRFIGIELASEGGLIESGDNLYCFERVSPRTLKNKNEAFDFGSQYRGFRYFDKYEPAQVDSLINLIKDLLGKFNIEKKVPKDKLAYYGKKLKNFNGIIGHTMVRSDKSDPAPDLNMWSKIVKECDLTEIDSNNTQEVEMKKLSDVDIENLFENNVLEINKMNVGSGSMVKQVIQELEQEKTYIKLKNAKENGHSVEYDFLEGNKDLVYAFADYLGFYKVTENKIEVLNA